MMCGRYMDHHFAFSFTVFAASCAILINFVTALDVQQSEICGPSHIISQRGKISSPNYPSSYPDHASCTWIIISRPAHVLTIRVTDLDIEEDKDCKDPPCCVNNWLSIPQDGGRTRQKLCGNLTHPISTTVLQQQTVIKFHTSDVHNKNRGFLLFYSMSEQQRCKTCPDGRCVADLAICNMFSCHGIVNKDIPCMGDSSDCFNQSQKCNGVYDCLSLKDEMNCIQCAPDEFPCNTGKGCYTFDQICDSKVDCADNTDEINCDMPGPCDGKIMCRDRSGCYSDSEHCDGVQNCGDFSDEEHCYRRFQCDDGSYIRHYQWCDGFDNCKDGSDEQGCNKTSVITAAIMGSLVCSLLLVIAVGCMCRLYSLRLAVTSNYRIHHDDASLSQQPSAPHLDEEFFNREPPPAYSVAVSNCPVPYAPAQSGSRLFSADQNASQRRLHHASRRTSRRNSNRRRSHRNVTSGLSSHCDSHLSVSMQSHTAASNYASLAISQLPPLNHSSSVVSTTVEADSAQQSESIFPSRDPDIKISNTTSNLTTAALVCEGLDSLPHRSYETSILDVPFTELHAENSVSPAHSASTSASESPSRNSITSSISLISYLSGDDDEPLLVIPAS